MAVTESTRLGLTLWSSADDVVTRTQFTQTNQRIDDRAAMFQKGPANAVPAPSASTDRMFWLTTEGLLYYCNGFVWSALNAFSGPAPLAGDSVESEGASPFLARADHVHGMPGFGMPVSVGTALAEGDLATLVRSNHTHRLSDGCIDVSAMFAAGVVEGGAIAAGAVIAGKVADGAVSNANMMGSSIITRDLLHSSVRQVPTGMIVAWGNETVPAGWLACEGDAVSRSTYAALFAVVGTLFGVGNGTTTFNLPNLGGRAVVGYNVAESEYNFLGKASGSKTHPLTVGEIPSHSHTINHAHAFSGDDLGYAAAMNYAGNHSHSTSVGGAGLLPTGYEAGGWGLQLGPGGFTNRTLVQYGYGTGAYLTNAGNHSHTITWPAADAGMSNTGSGQGHQNMQPYAVMRYLIRT